MMYELVIIWTAGEPNIYEYATLEDATQAGENMRMAFGNQIEWLGIRRKI